jgi:hypothetical protein
VARVLFVTVRPKNPDADDLGWAVVVNGCLVAWDTPHDTGLFLGEVADGFAQVLGVPVEHREVHLNPEGDWGWQDVLAQLGETPQPSPVVLSVQEDVAALVESGDPKLPTKVRAAVRERRITPDVVRRAAEIARDALLEGGYWDYLADAIEEALEEV